MITLLTELAADTAFAAAVCVALVLIMVGAAYLLNKLFDIFAEGF